MAPQGATRIKKGLPFVCPTGMELGKALRNTENLSKELTLLSSGAFSATPLPREGGYKLRQSRHLPL